MAAPSVKVAQLRLDLQLLPQNTRKHPSLRGPREAGDAATGVGAAVGRSLIRCENAVPGREAEQIALRRRPAAAGTAPHGLAPYDCSSAGDCSASIGIPYVKE